MNRRRMLIGAMAAVALAQAAVPLSMIAKREITLRDGRMVKFRSVPVDPYDAFRGRYVALGLSAANVAVTNAGAYGRGQKVYALLGEDAEGFAQISALSVRRPESGDFIRTRVNHAWGTNASVRLPFDRYYIPEHLASEAERAYARHASRTNRNAYVTVRVLNGFAVLENLFVDKRPIMEYLKQ